MTRMKKFLNYVLPSVLAMFVSSLYTIVDGMFVGRGVGDLALAAVNLVMPFNIMLFGLATMFAVGGGAIVSKHLGAGEKEEANHVFRQVFNFLLIISAVISLVCVIFAGPLVNGLGATQQTWLLAKDYLRFYAMFCMPNLLGIALNSFVRNDGKPRLAMISTILGALTNIALDYYFIFSLGLGIKGAAIATGLGQLVTIGVLLPHFILRKGELSFGWVRFTGETIWNFTKIGIPSFLAEVTFSIIILLENQVIVRMMGDIGLSAFSVINYLTTNVYMLLLGVAVGVQPLISFNFGAKKQEKMLHFHKLSNGASYVINIVFSGICFIWGKELIQVFSSNIEVIEIGYRGLNLFNLGFFLSGLNLNLTVYYQAIELPKYSNWICVFRSVLIFPVCLLGAVYLWNTDGIWLAFLFSEVFSYIGIKLMANLKKLTQYQIGIIE